MIVNILTCVTEFLVENLVRSRETEAWHTPNLTVGTYKTFECYRQTCCKTEYLAACWKDALLILLALVAEETLRWYAYDTNLYAVLTEKFCTANE